MAGELDTVPDFLAYLETRETLWKKGILSPVTEELNLLAIYKSRVDHIEKFLSGKIDHVVITGGIWEHYQKQRSAIDKRNRTRFPSYIIDDVIERLHTSIGFEPAGLIPKGVRPAHQQGTIESYAASIVELASLTRIERRGVGERFSDKMQKADAGGFRYGQCESYKWRANPTPQWRAKGCLCSRASLALQGKQGSLATYPARQPSLGSLLA